MKIIVLGAGLVGSAIVKDLAREDEYDILAVDINQSALDKNLIKSLQLAQNMLISQRRAVLPPGEGF